jgi:exosortase
MFAPVPDAAALATQTENATGSATRVRTDLVAGGLMLAVLWLVLWRHLSSEWSLNEQYSYGWFVPFFALFLLWLRWEDRPVAAPASRIARNVSAVIASGGLLLLLPIRLFEVGNPDWRPLGWAHAGVAVAVTLLVVWAAGGREWLKHFAFPIAFTLVAVPWISFVEEPVIQGLMRHVAAIAAETLNLFGIPAQLEGSLIRVSTGLVGVNEACSGVRSLQTSLMIGLLFGELKRLSVMRRVALVAAAVFIALIANCARALLLVWIAAAQRPEAVSKWHDIAGYSIVAIVFLGTMAVAAALGQKQADRSVAEVKRRGSVSGSPFIPHPSAFLLAVAWLIAIEVAVESWYRAHERSLVPVPGWAVRWPEHTPGFREIEIDEGVRRTLRFDSGREARWPLPAAAHSAGTVARACFAFFFRWDSGGSSVVRARAHRPDICLPNAGWEMINDRGIADYRVGNLKAPVPFRRVSFRREGADGYAHTFFCLQEDLRRPAEERPDLQLAAGAQPDWSIAGRARVVRNGVRNLGQQVLEIVLVGPDASEEQADREFTALLPELIVEQPRGKSAAQL